MTVVNVRLGFIFHILFSFLLFFYLRLEFSVTSQSHSHIVAIEHGKSF